MNAPSAPKTPPTASEAPPSVAIEKILWPYLKPHLPWVLGALAFNIIAGVSVAFQNLIPKYLIDDVILARTLTDAERIQAMLLLCGGYILVAVVTRMLFWHLGYRLFTRVREKVLLELRARFFRHINHLCLRFHGKHHSGELFSYLFGSPLQQIQLYLQQASFGLPCNAFMIVATLVWVAAWDPLLTGVLVLLVLINVWLQRHSQRRVGRLQAQFQSVESQVSSEVADWLRGRRDVKLYSMEEKTDSEFVTMADRISQTAYYRDVNGHMENMKQEGAGYLCFALLMSVCVWRYMQDQVLPDGQDRLTIGEIQGYLTSFVALQGPLAYLFAVATLRGSAQAGIDRIHAVLQTESTTPDPEGTVAPFPNRGAIRFDSVVFGYDPASPLLKSFTLEIPYGQKVALVGASGAGKSTLAQLLLRLYDPQSGKILVGGRDLRDCRGRDVRRAFAVVPQDPFIFRSTLRHNLSVAKPFASDQELRSACELAQAWEFIEKLPAGLDTPVGEGGATLSGGQRQRIAIARAILSGADFFIFDEATSALDTLSEHAIQKALEAVMPGRTTIIIAHRLVTVQSCDRIIVMEQGQIVQDGPPEVLSKVPGPFQRLSQGGNA